MDFSGTNCIKPLSLSHLADKREAMDTTYLDYNMDFEVQDILNPYSLEEGGTDKTIMR